MLVSQNFNPYNVNSKPLGFRGKADAAKKVADTFVPQKSIRGSRIVGEKGSVDKAVEKAVEQIDNLVEKFKGKK